MADTFEKDSDEKLDYPINWNTWLNGDTISESAWTVEDGITKVSDSKTDTTTTIWLSGGTSGTTYKVINKITTTGGRIKEHVIYVRIRDN